MNNVQAASCEYFEYLLWQNELEYNRRELAIFESFLTNKGNLVQPLVYKELMENIHDLMRHITKLLAEVTSQKMESTVDKSGDFQKAAAGQTASGLEKRKVDNRYFREEMFYYEQNYRIFRKKFCEFANGIEYA